MFRFGRFDMGDASSPSIEGEQQQQQQQDGVSNSSSNSNKSTSFLQRMASADTLLRSSAPLMKRPSFSSLQNSFSSSSGSSIASSFSIPVPTNSWGMLALSRLRAADDGEFDDVIDLLLTRDKAVLLLPVSQPSHPSAIIDREFIQDHVILYQASNDMSQVISLSGIRGTFQSDQFVALGLLPSEREISSIISGSSNKKSLFDTFSLDPSSIPLDCPKYNILHSHVQLPLKDDKIISAMLIQKPISKNDVVDWEAARKNNPGEHLSSTGSSNSNIENDRRVKDFIKNYRKRPPRNLDQASNHVLDFLDDMAARKNNDEYMDALECHVCYELYDCLFSTPGGDETLQDEALESRIAALNLLDLNLSHLGIVVEDESDVNDINVVVKDAGLQLQQLNSIPDAKGKLEGLVKTHQIIVEAIEGFAEKYRQAKLDTDLEVVQEMKHAMSAANEEEKAMSRKPSATGSSSILGDSSNNGDHGPLTMNEEDERKEGDSQEKVEGDEEKAQQSDAAAAATESPALSDGGQTLGSASADVLLPLLIFTIVKSNPTNFLSNLRFIHRFRRPSRILGQESYCLTNMMAAVSFLETTNLVGLGLSADKVLSHVTDLNSSSSKEMSGRTSPPAPPTPPKTTPAPPEPPRSSSVDATAGLKLMSDMVDSSYKMFDGLGRLWQRDAGKPPSKAGLSTTTDATAASRGRASTVTESELKDMPSNGSSSGIRGALSPSSSSSTDGGGASRTLSRRPDALHALLQAPSQLIHSVGNPRGQPSINKGEGPMQKFLDKKSVEDLKIGEVAELLADYKRLAAMMKQAGLC